MSRLRAFAGMARSLAIYRGRPWRIGALARFYATMVRPGDLAFDVGAHAGNRSHALVRAGARVVALEPQAAFHAFLARDLPPSVTLLRAAAGPAPGEATLRVSRLHPTLASIAPGFAERMGAAAGFAHVAWDAEETAPVVTLDALIATHGLPRLVKIDVEGYEAEVLAGLSRPVDWLSFEYLPAALDLAYACIERLEALAPRRYNLVVGERLAFALPAWLDAAAFRSALMAAARDGRSGDVYARA
ncbi:FkbM family methyltransferase [Amaricoccus sp.]|uniref:FkbM family methyltransferase n=1 Tax=Amaricoccus sp. TaxID=1872485 RepID=UPI001B604767|nr:FkbM family methyltransferase [Amaricoccus sp.]MBP7002812.1 FkbM family methyltransferase [Amaricoccus sp.]